MGKNSILRFKIQYTYIPSPWANGQIYVHTIAIHDDRWPEKFVIFLYKKFLNFQHEHPEKLMILSSSRKNLKNGDHCIKFLDPQLLIHLNHPTMPKRGLLGSHTRLGKTEPRPETLPEPTPKTINLNWTWNPKWPKPKQTELGSNFFLESCFSLKDKLVGQNINPWSQPDPKSY